MILERTHSSADALLEAFELVRATGRGTPRGVLTDNEQDLLRAMLVIAAAGLDSMLKQLIRDALPSLVRADDLVREELEKFVARSIRGTVDLPDTSTAKFIASVLASDSPQAKVIEAYIQDLTGGSLQSLAELHRVTSALGLQALEFDQRALKTIFEVRNRIIHELDINLDGDRRRRHDRGLDDMKRYANMLLETADRILRSVDDKLAEADA